MDLASIFFGAFLGLLVPTSVKAMRQTWSIWTRTKRLTNSYLYMIWVEATVNLIFAVTTYLYLCKIIQPSFAYYFGTVTLWAFQTQLLPQIIANRVGLIMVNKRKAQLLKWILFFLISSVNISVYCIWIPAQMESSSTFVTLNHIWERVEKSFFLIVDLGLNLYFLYLVRYRLIANGLTKYTRLFKFNAAIVFVSTSMDILLLGLLSLPNPYDYVQFAPVAYIIKLNIELTMAILISKVVRSSADRAEDWYSKGNHTSNGTQLTSRTAAGNPTPQSDSFFPGSGRKNVNIRGETANGHWSMCHYEQDQEKGIVKTVTTVGGAESGRDSCEEDRSEEGIMKTVTVAVRTVDGDDREDCSSTTRLA
ncbi:hypothetical protein K469DRAFT_740448 [Zopfia rhizophila CBS 207.26]|uniref:Integral membrane protein n=1 Tax=Zopfia rhizophila CBS 207.26 TaxID=1314779 RepID=A0A6A6DV85_9PEZI|nr:hypothetical protein K469DRAFT_740448 [Zopfia rhizophila CBS 207.26]